MKFIVNKSVGYELGGTLHPVDDVIELSEEIAAADVDRGFLVPVTPADRKPSAPAQLSAPAPRDGGVTDVSLSDVEPPKKK